MIGMALGVDAGPMAGIKTPYCFPGVSFHMARPSF